jgi:polar amino acid transport system substrate-binding protein
MDLNFAFQAIGYLYYPLAASIFASGLVVKTWPKLSASPRDLRLLYKVPMSSKGNTVSNVSSDVVKGLAPSGKLRAAINFGNIVLAQGSADAPRGVTVDLARELGRRLGVSVEFTSFDGAGKAFEAFKGGALDIIFLAIEPARAAEIAFTAPYVLIEGVYMVPNNSALKSAAEVDREDVRIGVNKGSAYDLYLTRTLKHAKLVRDDDGVDLFVKKKLEVAAGIKQPMVLYAKTDLNVRKLEGRFMVIQQAMGTRHGHEASVRYLRAFVEEMKASGFVADSLKRSNQPDAEVASAAT